MRIRIAIVLAAFLSASALVGQDAPAPASPAMSDCMKHCQQMAAARQKAQETQQAARNKMDAMFQEVRAALDTASKSKGDKKVAALQTAFEKLVAYHDAMHAQVSAMGEPHPMGMGSCCPGMEEHAMGGGCCGMASMKECPMMRGAAPAHH